MGESVIKQYLYFLSLFLLVFSLVSSLFFFFKVRERNQLIDELIDIAVKSKNLNDREEIVISLSKEIFKRTFKGINKDDLDLYSRIESTSFFNISSAVSLKYEGYGIIGHSLFCPCGTMSRTLLKGLSHICQRVRPRQKRTPGIYSS